MSRRRFQLHGNSIRRLVQIGFLVGFVALVLATYPTPGKQPSGWLHLYFDLDPFIFAITSLAAGAITTSLVLALVTVVVTIVLGRVFCGWFCPLGTVHAAAGRVFDYWRPRRRKEHWSRWQLSKYFLLSALLVMAVFGAPLLVIFDPIALLFRSLTTAVLPAFQWAVEDGSTALYNSETARNLGVTAVSEPTYAFLRDHLFVTSGQAFIGGGLIFAFFALIVGLNFYQRRFWCRYLCPAGAMLGILAWRPWLRRKVDPEACNQCDLCGMTCHGAATSQAGAGWKPQECFGCLNCTSVCRRSGLSFTLDTPWGRRDEQESVDLSRRGLLGAAAAGFAGLALLRITPEARGTTYNPQLIRPPGARGEHDFLERCIACGSCMKICPTGGLQPALTQAGLAGLWTPVLTPRIGYCDYECQRCGDVCPTGAIEPLSLADKQQVRLGLAAFDTGRCLPYAAGRDCMVCEEHCPAPDKAIYFVEAEVQTREGPRTVKQPHVDPSKCIGCGICEHVCPFRDKAAIRVTSANETRHPDNQPILPGYDAGAAYG